MNKSSFFILTAVFFLFFILAVGTGAAEEKSAMGGWDMEGDYNQLYKNSERDRIRGVVENITEVTPMPGMSPGVALAVTDSEGEKVMVHLAPKWYETAHPSGLREGDKVKIKGVWAEIGDREIFMAAKVKWNETEEYKVRKTKDGKPFWAMGKEEHAKETAEAD